MPLDPQLINGIRLPEVQPYGAAAANAMTLSQMAQRGRRNQQDIAQGDREAAAATREQQLRDLGGRLTVENTDDKGITNHEAIGVGLVNNGYGQEGAAYLAQARAAAKAQAEAEQAKKVAQAKLDHEEISNALAAVQTAAPGQEQATLTAVRGRLLARGKIQATDLSETYNPAEIAALAAEGRDAKAQIDAWEKGQVRAETHENNVGTRANVKAGQESVAATALAGQTSVATTAAAGQEVTRRGQDIDANTARSGQRVTMRGQDMTDSRARDLNEITRDNKPPTSAEQRALGFYVRAQGATKDIDTMEAEMGKKGFFSQVYYNNAPDAVQSDFNQAFRQAQRSFTEARLRKDSGAAIPPQEFENDARTYFPQPGNSPAVLAQKKASRETMLRALHLESGRAVRAIGDEPGDLKTRVPPMPKGDGKTLDRAMGAKFYEAAGGDPVKARQLATDNGWKVQ